MRSTCDYTLLRSCGVIAHAPECLQELAMKSFGVCRCRLCIAFKSGAVAISALLAGCCPPVHPNPDEVQAWIARELPKASSADDVRQFAQSHDFTYDYSTQTSAQLSRGVEGGCPGALPVVIINVEYDKEDHVKSVKAWGASMMP